MSPIQPIYKCHVCDAVSYQRVIKRAENGVLQPTGQYRCTGCRNIFESVRDWWQPNRVMRADLRTVPDMRQAAEALA